LGSPKILEAMLRLFSVGALMLEMQTKPKPW